MRKYSIQQIRVRGSDQWNLPAQFKPTLVNLHSSQHSTCEDFELPLFHASIALTSHVLLERDQLRVRIVDVDFVKDL